jgi:hypothetical protein
LSCGQRVFASLGRYRGTCLAISFFVGIVFSAIALRGTRKEKKKQSRCLSVSIFVLGCFVSSSQQNIVLSSMNVFDYLCLFLGVCGPGILKKGQPWTGSVNMRIMFSA